MLHFLFTFKGRVNRAKFWIFYLCASFGGALVGMSAFPVKQLLHMTLPTTGRVPLPWPFGSSWEPLGIAYTAFFVLFFYAVLAVVVKRFHDRNKSAWWLAFFYGAPLAFFAAAFFLGWPPHNDFPGQPVVMGVAFFACWLICMWYLIELLFLPGTRGANRFGPDPRVKKERIDPPQGGA